MGYCVYTGSEDRVPRSEHYDSSGKTLLAYAVRRTIGSALVFLVVVMLTMFAVASINTAPLRGGNPAVDTRLLHSWSQRSAGWDAFPLVVGVALGLAVAAIAVRRRLAG